MKVDRANIEDILPLNKSQENLLYESLLYNNTYVEQLTFFWKTERHVNRLYAVLQSMQQHHPSLRSVIRYKDLTKPVQIILRKQDVPLFIIGDDNPLDVMPQLETMPWLMMVSPKVDGFQLVLRYSHVLMDGWSLGIFLNELFSLFNGNEEYKKAYDSTQVSPYSAYNEKYTENITDNNLWQFYLQGFEFKNPVFSTYTVAQRKCVDVPLDWSTEFSNAIRNINLPLSALFYGIWGLIIQALHNQNDVLFGATVSGRNRFLEKCIIGNYVNVLPYRFKSHQDDIVLEAIHNAYNNFMHVADLDTIQQKSIKEIINLAQSDPLITSIVTIENYPLQGSIAKQVSNISFNENNPYPLELSVELFSNNEPKAHIFYHDGCYDSYILETLATRVAYIFHQIIANPAMKICELKLTLPLEDKLLTDINNTSNPAIPSEFLSFYLRIANYSAEKAAFLYQSKSYTYKEILNLQKRIALVLYQKYTSTNPVVAVCMNRTPMMVNVIFGILLSGGAYMPIDIHAPIARIREQLEDAGAQYLICDCFRQDFKELQIPILIADQLTQDSSIAAENCPIILPEPKDIAYVLFTSGSTGKPKGVMISHQAITNRLFWIKNFSKITSSDTILFKTPVTFDVSMIEILLWSISGCTLAILDQDSESNPDRLLHAINQYSVSIIHFVPSMLHAFLQYHTQDSLSSMQSLRLIFSSGEALPFPLVQYFKLLLSGKQLLNLYGPTEAAVDVSYYLCRDEETGEIPIGLPIDNVQLYVLDQFERIQPPFYPGELVISGIALAEGYINNEQMTAMQFRHINAVKKRVYFTGDCCIWDPNYGVYYKGRNDNQVKVNGRRLDLGEIEAALLAIPNIRDAAVLWYPEKNNNHNAMLVAFISISNNQQTEYSDQDIICTLKKQLLDYMIPKVFIRLQNIPLTAHGKRNNQALYQIYATQTLPALMANQTTESWNTIQQQIRTIWKSILRSSSFDLDTPFSDAGGDSIKLIYLCSEFRKIWDCGISLTDIASNLTIRKQAQLIHDHLNFSPSLTISPPINECEHIESVEWYPATAVQRDFYLASERLQNTAYLLSAAYTLTGYIDRNRFELAVTKLIQRHRVLRSFFQIRDSEINGILQTNLNYIVEWVDKEQVPSNRDIRLSTYPLFRFVISIQDDEHALLQLTIHHIIADGLSVNQLLQELGQLYNGELLPEPSVDFIDYCYATQETSVTQQIPPYWEEKIKQIPSSSGLIYLYGASPEKTGFLLSEAITTPFEKANPYDSAIFLGAAILLICRLTNRQSLSIGYTITGRTDVTWSHTVGSYANTLPFVTSISPGETIKAYIERIQKEVLILLEHQNISIGELSDRFSVNELFDVMFVYNNFSESALKLNGIHVEKHSIDKQTTKCPWTIFVHREDHRLEFEVATNLFQPEIAKSHLKRYLQIVEQLMVNSPDCLLSDLNYFLDSETKAFYLYNNTDAHIEDHSILSAIENVAKDNPTHIAIYDNQRETSYSTFLEVCKQLSMGLRILGIVPNDIVALHQKNSTELLCMMIAVWYCSATFTIIGPDTPSERIQFIYNDSGAKLLVSESPCVQVSCKDITYSQLLQLSKSGIPYTDPSSKFDHTHSLAYILYTSGSTGKPKGCRISHRSLSNYVQWARHHYEMSSMMNMPFFTSPAVDLTITSLFLPLVTGSSVIVYDSHPASFLRMLKDVRCSVIKLTPSHIRLALATKQIYNHVRCLIVGGEQFTSYLARKSATCFPNAIIYNEYGPTEATVGCMVYRYDPQTDYQDNIPIGVPINNMRIHLLDAAMLPCLPGTPGEIYISGVGVADGYTDPNDTALRFMQINDSASWTYKTGDCARFDADGNLIFCGRIDNQIKHGGYRIEPHEIEAALLKAPTVNGACVISHNDILYAFITPKFNPSDIKNIRTIIAQYLPRYMLPDHIIALDEFPISTSGKIQKYDLIHLLPERSSSDYTSDSEIQNQIFNIWAEVLNHNEFGFNDAFFDIGGSSIMLLKVHSLLSAHYDFLEIADYFSHKTINELSTYIASKTKNATLPIQLYNNLPENFCKAINTEFYSGSIVLEPTMLDRINLEAQTRHTDKFDLLTSILIMMVDQFITGYGSIWEIYHQNQEYVLRVEKGLSLQDIISLQPIPQNQASAWKNVNPHFIASEKICGDKDQSLQVYMGNDFVQFICDGKVADRDSLISLKNLYQAILNKIFL